MSSVGLVLIISSLILLYIGGIIIYGAFLKSEGIHYNYTDGDVNPEYLARLWLWPVFLSLRLVWLLWKSCYYLVYVGAYRSFVIVFKGEDK